MKKLFYGVLIISFSISIYAQKPVFEITQPASLVGSDGWRTKAFVVAK